MYSINTDLLSRNMHDNLWHSKNIMRYSNSPFLNTLTTKQNRRCGDANFVLEGYGETSIGDYLKMRNECINTFDEYNHKINGNETIGTIQALYPLYNHGHRLIIKNATAKGYLEAEEGDGVDISSRMEYHRGTVQKGKTQTLSTMGGESNGVVVDDLKIRKLTPKECFRLMGVKDEDYEKVAKNQSDSSLYHLAGDSIVVNVLMAIFKEMF